MPISEGRSLVVAIGKTLSLPCLLLLLLLNLPLHLAQRFPPFILPHSNNNNIRKHEQGTFINSHILEQEMEKTVYLFQGNTKNLTFTFSQTGLMSLAVTPCASEVRWSLFLKPTLGKDYKLHGQRIPRRPLMKVAQFQNESRDVFYKMDAMAGRYVLSMTSLHSDSHVRILVTRNITLQGMYPDLPLDRTVRTHIRKRKLTVMWSPATTSDNWTPPVKYCVSVSQIKNFKTHCAALAHKCGDRLPKYTRWGFPDEKKRIKELRKMAKPIKRVKKKLMSYHCMVGKTSFSFKKLRRGKKYFVDVFLVNKHTNGSSAYIGTSVERKKRRRMPKKNFALLQLGKTRTVNLKHTRGLRLDLNKTLPELVIEAVPCGGKLPVVLYYKHKKLEPTSTVRGWKRISVSPAKAGTYFMAFPGKRKKSPYVSVTASDNTKSKIVLPKTLKVTVRKTLTSCSNITLEWTESRAKQSYCLYKHVFSHPGKARGSRRGRCTSPSERPKSELVFCDRRKSSHPNRLRSYTVRGLQPSTLHRFDIFVGNRKSAMVPYQSVKETTTEKC